MTPEPEAGTVWGRDKPPDREGIVWKPIYGKWKKDRIEGWFAVATGQPDYDWSDLTGPVDFEQKEVGVDRSQPAGDRK